MTTITLPCLSIRQPWAWLIVNGYKDVENRTWKPQITFYRTLLIHAGKAIDYVGWLWVERSFSEINLPERSVIETGGIVGSVLMVTCLDDYLSPWFCGPWGWVFRNPKRLPFFQTKGRLGIFQAEYPEEWIGRGVTP